MLILIDTEADELELIFYGLPETESCRCVTHASVAFTISVGLEADASQIVACKGGGIWASPGKRSSENGRLSSG